MQQWVRQWTRARPRAGASPRKAGAAAEDAALAHLQAAGLRLVARNYETPGRGGGEIDLIMQTPDGTLVFVEVRQRSGSAHGGAAASVGARKQRRVALAARHFLRRYAAPPPCRSNGCRPLSTRHERGASPATQKEEQIWPEKMPFGANSTRTSCYGFKS